MSKTTQEWLETRFVEWRNKQPRGKDGVTQFAEYLGVSRNTMANWLNRGQTPDISSVTRLAQLGPEIYDLLGVPRPDPALQQVIEAWGSLSNEAREEIDAIRQRSAARREIGSDSGGVATPERHGETGN